MNDSITMIEDLPKNPRHVRLMGLIVGISRKRSIKKQSITPYIIHVTDFTKPAYRQNQYFNERNSFGKDFKQIVYDIDIFDEDLKYLQNYNQLIQNVRYFEYFHGDIVYEAKNHGFNWNIGNLGIWIEVFIKGKVYNNILELKCESKQIRNLRISKDIRDYHTDVHYPIWNKSINYFGVEVLKNVFVGGGGMEMGMVRRDDGGGRYGDVNREDYDNGNHIQNRHHNYYHKDYHSHSSVSSSSSSDGKGNSNSSNSSNISSQSQSQIQIQSQIQSQSQSQSQRQSESQSQRQSQSQSQSHSQSQRSYTSPKSHEIVTVNYNKINLLKNSIRLNVNESYYVKVKIEKVVNRYSEYIFYNFNKAKFDIKNIDIVIRDNNGDRLLVEVRGEDLIRFLEIDNISIRNLNIEGLNFINDRIKEEIDNINSNNKDRDHDSHYGNDDNQDDNTNNNNNNNNNNNTNNAIINSNDNNIDDNNIDNNNIDNNDTNINHNNTNINNDNSHTDKKDITYTNTNNNNKSKGMLIRPYEKLICGVLPHDVAVQAWLWIFNDVSSNN